MNTQEFVKEVDKLRLNSKFDTQFKIKDLKKELLLNRLNNDKLRDCLLYTSDAADDVVDV
jgi:hypothetical protein